MTSTQKWTEDRVSNLVGIVGSDQGAEVTAELQHTAAESLGVTVRSIAAKLRNLDYAVASTAAKAVAKYTPAQEEELRAFVESNAGKYTYAEIAENVLSGAKNAKEIQGKILSMELFSKVKPTPKVVVAKKYSDEEEAKFVSLMQSGAFLEEIADAMGRELNSVRGKALSLTRKDDTLSMPKQKESHAKVKGDILDGIEDIASMKVAEIATAIERTERGVRVMLTRRGITVADYDGAKKQAKAAEKK